jgi:quercetin dioxygenase-like cupin family protein
MIHKKADETPANDVKAGSGTTIQVLIGSDDAPDFVMRRFVMKPGGGMPMHTNLVQHEQYVLQGRARVRIGDAEIEVVKDDVVFIPAGVPHSYESIGKEDFVFLCMVPNRRDEIEIVRT